MEGLILIGAILAGVIFLVGYNVGVRHGVEGEREQQRIEKEFGR